MDVVRCECVDPSKTLPDHLPDDLDDLLSGLVPPVSLHQARIIDLDLVLFGILWYPLVKTSTSIQWLARNPRV